jgi:hypothetical protein
MKLSSFSNQTILFHPYQMSSDEDSFYNHHPNTVMLGNLGAVARILLLLMFALWIGYKIW